MRNFKERERGNGTDMKCEELQNLILALPDPAQPTPELQQHLRGCAACRAVQARARNLDTLLAGLPAPASRVAREAFLAEVGSVAPIIASTHRKAPVKRSWLRAVKWQHAVGIAAAIFIAIGSGWAIFHKRGATPEMAEKPRHELLNQEMKHLTALSQANSATQRLQVWGAWAIDLRKESQAIHKVAQPEEMATLSTMFDKAVSRGMLAQAQEIGLTVPAAERHAALTSAIQQLADAEVEASTLAQSAPTPTQKYFTRMADTAKTARQTLNQRLTGKGS